MSEARRRCPEALIVPLEYHGVAVEADVRAAYDGSTLPVATLIRIILDQQVTLASGAAAYRRLSVALGRTTPRRVLDHTHDELMQLEDGTYRKLVEIQSEWSQSIAVGG